jgi:predicted amidohydrolase
MTIGAGLIELSDDDLLFNTYVVAMPDGRIEKHRKLHCFISPHMESGDQITVFDIPCGCRVGVLICYDNNIIENVRLTALQGAEVLLAPHQTGGCQSRSPGGMKPIPLELWQRRHDDPQAIKAACQGPNGRQWLLRWLPSRAHDNGLFVIFSNGIGIDDDEVRTGNAMILGPYGEILAETTRVENDMVIADLDPAGRDMCTGCRWMTARRPELYGALAQPTGRERGIRHARFSTEL